MEPIRTSDPPDDMVTRIERALQPIERSTGVSSKTYKLNEPRADTYVVQIVSTAGHYTFNVLPNTDPAISGDGDLLVHDAHRDLKSGRFLVELHERLAIELGIETIVIGENWNDSFWAHLGYAQVTQPHLHAYRGLAQPHGALAFDETNARGKERWAFPRHRIL